MQCRNRKVRIFGPHPPFRAGIERGHRIEAEPIHDRRRHDQFQLIFGDCNIDRILLGQVGKRAGDRSAWPNS